jgi:hypothetical protein
MGRGVSDSDCVYVDISVVLLSAWHSESGIEIANAYNTQVMKG